MIAFEWLFPYIKNGQHFISKILSNRHGKPINKDTIKASNSFWREKMWQNGCKRYKNPPEDKKQKLVGYRKRYYKMWKSAKH